MKTSYTISQLLCLLTLTLAYDTPPSITVSPSNQAVDVRRDLVLHCEATGTPAPTYSWKRNGSDFVLRDNPRANMSNGDLTISRPEVADNGVYQCFANNPLGTSMSAKAVVQLSWLEKFGDTEPSTINKRVGDFMKLRCGHQFGPPVGSPPPLIYWTYTEAANRPALINYDARVSQDPEGNLVFSNIMESDAKKYKCSAYQDSISESRSSPVITVNVNADVEPVPGAPVLVSPSSSSVSTIGLRTEKFVMKCIAQGYPTPTIVWKLGGQEVEARDQTVGFSDRIVTAYQGQELIFKTLEFTDKGEYSCEATNTEGSTSATFILNVESAPYYADPPEDETKGPTETVVIECVAGGVPAPKVDILVNGQPWADFQDSYETGGRWTVSTGQPKRASIEITDLQTTDTNVFQCLATNSYKEALTSVVLNVVSIPATIQEFVPRALIVFQDNSATLSCRFNGRPWPSIAWTFKGTELTDGSKYAIDTDTGDLVINSITSADDGEYLCTITNTIDGNDNVDTDSGEITVIDDTTIVMPPEDQTVNKGESAFFQCEIQYDELLDVEPDVYWMKGSTRYNAASDNSLVISNAVIDNTGTYKCVVNTTIDANSNRYQVVESSASLTVKGPPSPPTNIRLYSGEQQFVFTLNFDAGSDNNEPIEYFAIEYDTEWADRHWVNIENVSFSATHDSYRKVLLMDPYVRYDFRVIAYNKLGASDPSEVYSMTDRTAPASPTLNPQNVQGSSTDPSSLVIRWDRVEPYYYGGNNFRYLVKYRVVGSGADWTEEEVTGNVMLVAANKPYEKYEFTVQSRNDVGIGPMESPLIGYSGEASPSAAPGNVNVDVLSASEVNVTWEAVSEEQANGNLQGYNVYYNRRIASGQDRLQCAKSPCVVGGLQAASQYEFSVKAYTGAGEGPASSVVVVTTMEAPPGPVRLTLTAYSYRIVLDWRPPIEINGILQGYKISYAPMVDENSVGEWTFLTFTPEDKTYLLLDEKIEPETKYRFEVVAFNGLGEGARVTEEPKTKLAGRPAMPPKPLLDDIKLHNVTFGWDLQNLDPTPETVLVEYKKKSDEDESGFIQTEVVNLLEAKKIMVSGLESTTQYVARLQVTNKAGTTVGAETTFKTAGTEESTDPGFVMGTWLIILICIIIFLILILLIICIIKSQKGGKYNVSDKEKQLNKDIESTPLKDDGGFDEYKPPMDGEPIRGSQGSLNDSEHGSSETDSLKEYADGDMGKFDEEGSFIGQYGDNKKQRPAEDGEPGGGAAYSTFV